MSKDKRTDVTDVNDAGVTVRNRAAANEGTRVNAPSPDELGFVENSIFDGAGNEVIVVSTTNEDGERKQGTGPTREAALKDAQTTKEPIGKGFWSH